MKTSTLSRIEKHTVLRAPRSRVPEGTRLTVVESGFEGISADRLQKAYRGNESGWSAQLENIRRYVGSTA